MKVKIRRRKFPTVYVDPPWPERGGGKIKRGADRHYPTMTRREILAFPIDRWAAEDCHLYMWVTNNYLEFAFEVLRAWGFRYITAITWMKDRQGLGAVLSGHHRTLSVRGARKDSLPALSRREAASGTDGVLLRAPHPAFEETEAYA